MVPYDADKIVSRSTTILCSPESMILANNLEIQSTEIQNDEPPGNSPIQRVAQNYDPEE